MPKRNTIIINRFDGGIADDTRAANTNEYALTKHFDVFNGSGNLTPFRDFTANEFPNDLNLTQFVYADENIYALGTPLGSNAAKIYRKNGEVIDGNWIENRSIEGTGSRNDQVFFHYKNYLYGWRSQSHLWRHGDITGAAETHADYQSIAYDTVAQPIHYSADDSAYFFADNKVYRLNYDNVTQDVTWEGVVLTLPNDQVITCATEYGAFLAIGAQSKSGVGDATVYLWDRDSSLKTVTAKYKWGSGSLSGLGVSDGYLIGIGYIGGYSFNIKNTLAVRQLIGDQFYSIKEISLDKDYSYRLGQRTHEDNGKLYFSVSSYQDTPGELTGIWVVGRQAHQSPLTVTQAYSVPTDGLDLISGFFFLNDYLFVSHSEGQVDRISKTATYTVPSVYESAIFSSEGITQDLVGVTVTTTPLPEDGQVVLKYKRDADTDWTTVFTHTDDNSLRHTAVKDASGNELGHFKEVQFRIESTGGAVITGLRITYEPVVDDII